MQSSTRYETALWHKGYRGVAGVDEAGRGPLAGPVMAAALVIAPGTSLPSLKDSKHLSYTQREELFSLFGKTEGVSYAVGRVSNRVIDRINIHQATLLAMSRAVNNLAKRTSIDYLLVDGTFPVPLELPQKTIITGDELVRAVAAASIVAKVMRDRLMGKYHKRYPEYAFSMHKGYGTPLHMASLKKHGPCEYHRMSFAPLAA